MAHQARKSIAKYTPWDLVPLLALACAAIATFYPVRTTFDVLAVTDQLVCITSRQTTPFKWIFQEAELLDGWGDETEHPEHIGEGIFEPAQDIDIEFQRIGHGDLSIDCHAHETNSSVGTLSISSNQRQLKDKAVFRVHVPNNKESMMFVIACQVSLGNVLKPRSPRTDN